MCVVSLFSLMPKFCENASAIFNTFVRPNRSASGIKQLVSGNGGLNPALSHDPMEPAMMVELWGGISFFCVAPSRMGPALSATSGGFSNSGSRLRAGHGSHRDANSYSTRLGGNPTPGPKNGI